MNATKLISRSLKLRFLCLTLSVALISGCSSIQSPPESPVIPTKATTTSQNFPKENKLEVPKTCENQLILRAFPDDVLNPVFIDTRWDPSPGTELEYFFSNNGLVCSYGIQRDEVGVTIRWVKGVDKYKELSSDWVDAGLLPYSISELEADQIYIKSEGSQEDQTYKIITYNILYKGYWVQVNGTFFYSDFQSIPIIKAALQSLDM